MAEKKQSSDPYLVSMPEERLEPRNKRRRKAARSSQPADWRSIQDDREKYAAYLCSREWSVKREAVRKRSGGKCERCHVLPMDHVHHLTYERKYHEELEDLQASCKACHEFTHGKSEFDPCSDEPEIKYLMACVLCGNDIPPIPVEVLEFGPSPGLLLACGTLNSLANLCECITSPADLEWQSSVSWSIAAGVDVAIGCRVSLLPRKWRKLFHAETYYSAIHSLGLVAASDPRLWVDENTEVNDG
jgi:hypothetical protein